MSAVTASKNQFSDAERIRETGADHDPASFESAFERTVGAPGEKGAGRNMKRGVLTVIALALAGCNSQIQPQPQADLRPSYSDEELAKLPVAQRCRYLSELFARAISDPRADESMKQKTYQAWPLTMQKWGCEATFRVWKPAS
jgi:hypothetical protein